MKYTFILWTIIVGLTFALIWSLNRQQTLLQKANEPKIQLDSVFLQVDVADYPFSEFETYHRNLYNTDELKYTDYVRPIYIKYKQPINGYKVYVTWWMSFCNSGFALLKFVEPTGNEFFLVNEAFHIDFDKIWEEASNFIIPNTYYYRANTAPKQVYIINYQTNKHPKDSLDYNAPFFFSDVDFDGHQELVMTLYRTGQRFTDEYQVYKFGYGYGHIREVKAEPYVSFDGLTKFDYQNKKVIIYHSAGIYSDEDIYRYCDTCYLPLVFERNIFLGVE